MAWRLDRYDAERGNTPDNQVNGSGVVGIRYGNNIEYQWCSRMQHCGDTLRLLVRYYRTPAAVEQLRLYMRSHGYFVLAPRVSLCTNSKPQTVSKMLRDSWETGTSQSNREMGSYGSIFMHEKERWWLRDNRNYWVPADDLFKKAPP